METYDMFERMEITEQVYKGGTPSKTTTREDPNRSSHGRKCKGGEAALSTNPEKGRADKSKKKDAGHMSDRPTGENIFLVHGPRHSTDDCKLLKEYSNNYAVQRDHKESRSGGNKKRGKSVKFDGETKEVNIMVSHAKSNPKNKKGGKQKEKTKSK